MGKNSYGGVEIIEPDVENPKTFDGIETSIFMGTISLIGLSVATIYLKKKKSKNKLRVSVIKIYSKTKVYEKSYVFLV